MADPQPPSGPRPSGAPGPSRRGPARGATTPAVPVGAGDSDPLDALAGWLALLPGWVLCWPWPSPLDAVPTTASAAAGWAALLALPGLVLVALRRRTPWSATPRWVLALGLVLAWVLLAGFTPLGPLGTRAGDGFEARRATLSTLTAAAALLTGAGLGPAGRRAALRAASGLPLLLGLGALWTGRPEGTLGNVGDVVEVAAPCALAALGLFVLGRGAERALALASGLAFALLCGLGGSLVGLVGFLAPLAVLLVLLPRAPRLGRLVRVGLVVGLAVSAVFLARGTLSPERAPAGDPGLPAPAEATETGNGGLAFRLLTWARLPALLRDHPLGVGPGQFAREFPPYRDPAEIDLSSHQRREPTPIAVEHAHSDPLELLVEHGLPVGALAVGLWLALGIYAVRALARAGARRAGDEDDDDEDDERSLPLPTRDEAWRGGLALAVLGLLTVGLANAALTYGVASAPVGLALAGALLAPVEERRARPSRGLRLTPELVVLALLATHAGEARALVEHGAALAGLREARVEVDGVPYLDPERARPAVRRALRAAPDSVVALRQSARLEGLEPSEVERVWLRLLERRPYDVAGLMSLGTLYALAGELGPASECYDRAVALDPDSPELLRNRLRLALDAGQLARTREALTDLDRLGEPDEAERRSLRQMGLRQLRLGRVALAREVLRVVDPDLDVSDANACWQRAQAARDAGLEDREHAFLTGAHLLFARDHAARRSWDDAVRSYRQALRYSARAGEHPDGSPLLRVELAAALWRANEQAAAREELADLTVQPQDLLHLDPWAGQVLIDGGLLRLRAGDGGGEGDEDQDDE